MNAKVDHSWNVFLTKYEIADDESNDMAASAPVHFEWQESPLTHKARAKPSVRNIETPWVPKDD